MKRLPFVCFFATFVAAQTQTGSIEGVVLDSATHGGVKAAVVVTFVPEPMPDRPSQEGVVRLLQRPRQVSAKTDASGAFALRDLPPGTYSLHVNHPRYPQPRGPAMKTIDVKRGETARASFELTPGASVSGKVVDEDGDPLPGCMPQVVGLRPDEPAGAMQTEPADANGTYHVSGIAATRFKVLMRCWNSILEPFPLQPMNRPRPATVAYPPIFYPGVTSLEQAQVVEAGPGVEKQGIDFQMRPARVFALKGTLRGGSGDLSKATVSVMTRNPSERQSAVPYSGWVDAVKGTFAIERIFPGSYTLYAFVAGESNSYAASQPVEIPGAGALDLELKPGVDVAGKVEVEGEFKYPLNTITVQLTNPAPFGMGSGAPTQTREDGTFTLSRVLPGAYRVDAYGPNVFIKTVQWGGQDLPDGVLDTSAGGTGPLRVVVSGNTATIKGTAPPNAFVEAVAVSPSTPIRMGATVDQGGAFTIRGLRPGRYRVVLGGTPTDEDAGEEMNLSEGETATVTVREPVQR